MCVCLGILLQADELEINIYLKTTSHYMSYKHYEFLGILTQITICNS